MEVQGCKLWSHPDGLAEAPLPEALLGLVGRGCAGPPVDVGGAELTKEQRACCRGGLDAQQLAMLRAQVRSGAADPSPSRPALSLVPPEGGFISANSYSPALLTFAEQGTVTVPMRLLSGCKGLLSLESSDPARQQLWPR